MSVETIVPFWRPLEWCVISYYECLAVTFVNIGQNVKTELGTRTHTRDTVLYLVFVLLYTTTTITTINTGGAERTRKPRRREKCHQPPTLGIRRVFPHATFEPSEVRRGFNNRHVCGGARCV